MAAAAAALTACGGGGSSTAGSGDSSAFAASYAANLSQLSTAAVLTSPALQDQFSTNYLDAGTTKTQVVAALNQDAAAIGADSSFSLFPMGSLTDVSVSNCNSANVCTLTGTLTNADADSTSVPFATQIVLENGTWRLYGDQQSS
jgi:hypothetical protein